MTKLVGGGSGGAGGLGGLGGGSLQSRHVWAVALSIRRETRVRTSWLRSLDIAAGGLTRAGRVGRAEAPAGWAAAAATARAAAAAATAA